MGKEKRKRSITKKRLDDEEKMEEEEPRSRIIKKPARKLKDDKKPATSKEDSDSDFEAYLDENEIDSEEETVADAAAEGEEMDSDEEEGYRTSMKGLQSHDPEFYKFLLENNKDLLTLDDEEEDDDEGMDEAAEEMEDEDDGMEDEYIDDEEEDENVQVEEEDPKLTLDQISTWKKALQANPTFGIVRQVIRSLHKALASFDDDSFEYTGPTEFNALVPVCLMCLPKAFNDLLNIKSDKITSRNWKKISPMVKIHLRDLLKLINKYTDTAKICAFLRYLGRIVPVCLPFKPILFNIMKMLVKKWSSGKIEIQKLAYRVLVQLLKDDVEDKFMAYTLKEMYRTYVSHAKFTKASSLDTLAYMHKTLSQAYGKNPQLAYEHCEIYLKNLGIQMLAAINHKTKEHYAAVYNWQFIHCLHLWTEVVIGVDSCTPLVYPLGMLLTGTVELIPAARFIPLRFHVVRIANKLMYGTGHYIPTFLEAFKPLELLNLQKNVMAKKRSDKINFSSILRLSQGQLKDPQVKLALVLETCLLLVETLALQASSQAFPDFAVEPIHKMRTLLKKLSFIGYKKPLKHVLTKVEENVAFIKKHPYRGSIFDMDQMLLYKQNSDITPLVQFLVELREERVQLGGTKTLPPSSPKEENTDQKTKQKTKDKKKKQTLILEPPSDAEDEVTDLVISEEEDEEEEEAKEASTTDDDDDDL